MNNITVENLTSDYVNHNGEAQSEIDVALMNKLSPSNQYAVDIHVGKSPLNNIWQIKMFRYNAMISLSRGLPTIENFGFKLIDENPFIVNLANGDSVHVCDFGVQVPEATLAKIADGELQEKLKKALVAAFKREIENDALNKLVLLSGLGHRQVALIRAVVHYLVQTNLNFSLSYMNDTLVRNPQFVHELFGLFAAKFCLNHHNKDGEARAEKALEKELSKIENIAEDQILRAATSVVRAMLRTNYFQTLDDGAHKRYISFKLDSAQVLNLPKPVPFREIFVYSRWFEAIHLRGGKVARGGLRWSDRNEDFRTEVLGLVKAQMVKNSVIVPTGSKGGFVCKKLPPISNREAYLAEGVKCYKEFISGLLDITDNLVNGKVVKPAQAICHDGDDPYLVVAADKGTATFSDYANEMSQKYGFWLGDAFASGGSAGYDHKKMGITAKGAWEAVKRHFRHLGLNTQTQDFTVIGIGDLMGDVFGNGMLLSEKIKLIAAFNHQHIFLDPNPDTAVSYQERLRMFNLPRSSWDDYDQTTISHGGGIYLRSSKSIPLSAEVKAWLGVAADELAPDELIHLILQAKADLLYNGGIGTYIKAESQSNEEVKDKANDNLRVNGNQLQVKVIGEGGNLGATQLGRIEFAKKGGLICTDAIDNSAGVDCSDHEVNIKILFAAVMQATGMTSAERNQILESMTDEVGYLVLRDNYLQTLALKNAEYRAKYTFPYHCNFMRMLEKAGELDRKVEFLPDDKEINARTLNGEGLTVPEMSVVLAYAKMSLDRELLHSSIVSDNNFDGLLLSYFPQYLQEHYADYITSHYLRKEIIANQLANLVVNRAGMTFISRFSDEFSMPLEQIVRAWWIAYNLLDGNSRFADIEALDNQVKAQTQVRLFIGMEKAIERLCRWILRNVADLNSVSEIIERYRPYVGELIASLDALIVAAEYKDVQVLASEFASEGVPQQVAILASRANYLPQLMSIVALAQENNFGYEEVARSYFAAGRDLQIDWLRNSVFALPRDNKWQVLARSALIADVVGLYAILIKKVIADQGNLDTASWFKANQSKVAKIRAMEDELQSYRELDLAMLSAATREFENILS